MTPQKGISVIVAFSVLFVVISLATIVSSQSIHVSVKDYGAKGDGVADDTKAIQDAIDYVYSNGGGKVYFPSGTYNVNANGVVIIIYPGIEYYGDGATSIIMKKPYLVNDIGVQKSVRIFTTSKSPYYGYCGQTDSAPMIIRDMAFDGTSQTQGTYKNYEQEHSAMIFLTADTACPGKLKVVVRNLYFKDGTGDGIHVWKQVDIDAQNIIAENVFRGGFTATGGESIMFVKNLTTRGKIDPTGIDIEIESAAVGYHGSSVVRVHLEDIHLEDGDFDVAPEGNDEISYIYGKNIFSNSASSGTKSFNLGALKAVVFIEDSSFDVSEGDRLNFPYDVTFRNCTFRAVKNASRDSPGIVHASPYIYWITSYSTPSKKRLIFDSCTFLAGNPLPEDEAVGIYLNNDNYDLNNYLIVKDSKIENSIDVGIKTSSRGGNWIIENTKISSDQALYCVGFEASGFKSFMNVSLNGLQFTGSKYIHIDGYSAPQENTFEHTNVVMDQSSNYISSRYGIEGNKYSGYRTITGSSPPTSSTHCLIGDIYKIDQFQMWRCTKAGYFNIKSNSNIPSTWDPVKTSVNDKIQAGYTYSHAMEVEDFEELMSHGVNAYIIKGNLGNNVKYASDPDGLNDLVRKFASIADQKNVMFFQALNFVHVVTSYPISSNNAVYSDGTVGQHISPWEPAYWSHLTSLVVNLARLDLKDGYRVDGVWFDFELYGQDTRGEPYWIGRDWGFEDINYNEFLSQNSITGAATEYTKRKQWLADNGYIEKYYSFLEKKIYNLAKGMREAVKAVNPNFFIGSYPTYETSLNSYVWDIYSGWSTPDQPMIVWDTNSYGSGGADNIKKLYPYKEYFNLTPTYGKEVYAYYPVGVINYAYSPNNWAYTLYSISENTSGYWIYTTYSFTSPYESLPVGYRLGCYNEPLNSMIFCTNSNEYQESVDYYYNQMDYAKEEIEKRFKDIKYVTWLTKKPSPGLFRDPDTSHIEKDYYYPIDNSGTLGYITSPLRYRKGNNFLIFAKKGFNVEMELTSVRVGSRDIKEGLGCLILDMDSNEVKRILIEEGKTSKITFVPEETGQYSMHCNGGNNAFNIKSINVPIMHYPGETQLISIPGSMYFYVDSTTPKLSFKFTGGTGREGLSARISKPISSGYQEVGFNYTNEVRNMFTIDFDIQAGDMDKVWRLDIEKPLPNPSLPILEDVHIFSPVYLGLADDKKSLLRACEITNGGVETTDGIDNDCNGIIDDAISQNLVRNPGFEEGVYPNGTPLYWNDYYRSYSGKKEMDSSEKRTGSYSWKFTQDDSRGYQGAYSDFIPIKQNMVYMYSVWAKCLNETEFVYIGFDEFYENKTSLGWDGIRNNVLSRQLIKTSWEKYSAPYIPINKDAKYIKLRFFGPYTSNGSVWFDDFSFTEQFDFSQKIYGCKNDQESVCLDFGENENVGTFTNVMTEIKTEGSIKYRELKPRQVLYVEIPAFNVDGDGYPLTPMVLEFNYKDTINASFYSASSSTYRRAKVSSLINYFYDEIPTMKDKEYYDILGLGTLGDNQWKVDSYGYAVTQFPLIRAVGGKFKIRISMPTQAEDSNLYLPIDYIALHKISDEEYITKFYERDKLRMGFIKIDMPTDEPSSPVNYPGLVVFSRDPMKPVYKNTIPDPSEITSSVNTFSTLGEIEPIQLSFYSKNKVDGITVEVSDLVGPSDIITKGSIRIEKVMYEERRVNPYLDKKYALIPDRIEPFSILSFEGSQSVWIKIFVPENLKGGTYNGKIYVKQNGNSVKTLDIIIEVLPITLDLPENMNAVYHWPYIKTFSSNLSEVFRVYREAQLEPFMYIGNSHVRLIKQGGEIDFNTTGLEEVLDRLIKEKHLKNRAIVEYGWGIVFSNTVGGSSGESNPYIYYNLSDPRFVEAYGLAIRKIIEVGKSRGINFIFSTGDEPGIRPYYRIVSDRIFTIIKNNGGKTSVTYYGTCETEIDSLPDYFTPNNKIAPLTGLVDYKVWSPSYMGVGYDKGYSDFSYYTTSMSYLRNPVYNRFVHGIFPYRTDSKIVSAYAMGDLITDPFNDFDQGWRYLSTFTYPDFVFAYPTKTGKLLENFAIEGIREGIKDAKYFATLERMIKENPTSSVSFQARSYLDSLNARIKTDFWKSYGISTERQQYGYYELILQDISESRNPTDWEAFTKIRRRLFNYILELTGGKTTKTNLIQFISPTPTASQRLSTGRFTIKAQINSTTLQSLQLLWNGKNYPILSQNAILKYNFDQNAQIGETSTTFKDLTAKANHGTGLNLEGDESVQGKYNKALQLDGANDKIQIPHNPNQQVTNKGTWNYWVNLKSYDGCQSFLSKRDTHNTNAAWAMGINFGYPGANKNFTFEYNIDNQRNWAYGYDKTSIPLNQWAMLTFVYNSQDSRNVRFYVDGKEVEPILDEAQNSPLYNSNSPIYIGAVNNGASCYFNGSIDELSIVGEALSQNEIQILYESSLVKQDSSTWVFTLNMGETIPLPEGTYTYSLTTSDPSVGSESRILFVGAETGGIVPEGTEGGEVQGSPGGGKGTVYETKKGACNSGETNPCGSSIGECKQGTQSCVNGQWTECIGATDPTEEICDGLDNNCNGQIDENCLCVEGQNKPCGSNIGICKQGVQSCVSGQWGACIGNTPPLTEDTCFNYLDDNCNGEVDEECDEAFETCNNGKLDSGEQGTDCGGKCPKKCPDMELISVLMILVGLFGMIGTTVYFGYVK